MLKRKITDIFNSWKQNPDRNPLVVKGCRQCGKTYSVLDFARNNYKSMVYINFYENPAYKSAFEGSMEIDKIIMFLSAITGSEASFIEHETCIILDELQECPKARTALKFFKTDGRYDVISTGYLLGLSGYRDYPASIPVGYETVIDMYPLDFEEFLWACGISEKAIAALENHLSELTPVEDVLHQRMRELLLQYVIVGGMPAVVSEFLNRHLLNNVLSMQRDIVNAYRDDMVKYADAADKAMIRECFDSIPSQLAKENKKFQYSLIKKGTKSAHYAGSLRWIEDAGIIRRCHNLSITELPLDGNAEENVFKVYMADIGLFVSMLEDGTQYDILNGNLLSYKGAIFENLAADFLGKAGRKLYYFRKDTGLEVDFVTRLRGRCTLIECKASTGRTKSTRTILSHPEKYHVGEAIKLGDYNIGTATEGRGTITTLPLYMGFAVAKIRS